jgi:rfaE bifunctional protein kinase chain/domain
MSYLVDTNVKILVVGDLMIDHYIYGSCDRISPEAPVPVVEVRREEYTLGGAGNVLKNLLTFGCQSNIISIVGDDENANTVLYELANLGIHKPGIVNDVSRCTTIKTRVLANNHQLIRLDRENTQAINIEKENSIIEVLKQNIASYDLVLLSDYNKGLLSNSLLEKIVALCKNSGVKTIVDPKGNDFSKYKGVNIIKPNRKEASIATGIVIKNNESLLEACIKIKQIVNCDSVVVTMSEDGIAIYDNDKLTIIPTKALDVVDVTGAGDTVLASLGLSIASGNTIDVACDFANHAAAVVVSKVGSATASIQEINEKILS